MFFLEHLGYDEALPKALTEFLWVLVPGGILMTSVPDLNVLCWIFLSPNLTGQEKISRYAADVWWAKDEL
jgi:predicted SAM-dependent methyltransferase